VVRCSDAKASSFVAKVRSEILAHFHAVALKVTVICGIDCLACQNDLVVKNPHYVKEIDEHAHDFVLHLSRLFRAP
jgi:hypothetical protein